METFYLSLEEEAAHFLGLVVFGDEKWWVLDLYLNSQNDNSFWSPVPPDDIYECKYQGHKKAMSWCGILQGAILGPFWFVHDNEYPQEIKCVTRPFFVLKNNGSFISTIYHYRKITITLP